MSQKIYSDEREPFPMFGIETGEGWKPIAMKVINAIIEYNDNSPEDSVIYIDQVKEKFAGLRIYVTYDNVPKETIDRIDNLIKEAEKEAAHTCEECGAKENIGMRVNGWYTVMCEDCAKKIVNSDSVYKYIKWKRQSDGKLFLINKDGVEEIEQNKDESI